MANGPMLRMNELDKVEKEVVNCLGSAGRALEEIGKDKPSQKQVDNLVSQFMTSLQVEIWCKGVNFNASVWFTKSFPRFWQENPGVALAYQTQVEITADNESIARYFGR